MKLRLAQSRLIEADSHAIKCALCALPSVEIRAGLLIVRNRHHGQTHKNSLSLEWLLRKVEELKVKPSTNDAR